jgi:hypothetical protein
MRPLRQVQDQGVASALSARCRPSKVFPPRGSRISVAPPHLSLCKSQLVGEAADLVFFITRRFVQDRRSTLPSRVQACLLVRLMKPNAPSGGK